MTTVEFKLSLPDDLAREAGAAGLLTPEAIEAWLRSEVRQRRVEQFFAAADRLAALGIPPMTPEELGAEIDAARAEKRAPDAGRR